MRFRDKVAIITGAGQGIGKATAAILAGEGAHVAAVDINAAALDRLTEEANGGEGAITVFVVDVLDGEQVQKLVDKVVEAHGKVDILVNAVGGSTIIPNYTASVDELTADDWDKIVEFNLKGTFLCTSAVVKQMKRQRGGKIINLSSDTAHGLTLETSSAYAAAKAGIVTFTKKVAREVGPYGITCNAIAPGLTLSERILTDSSWAVMSEAERAKASESIPLGRVALPEDQAKVIAFLASRDADYVTGVTIDVNGGLF